MLTVKNLVEKLELEVVAGENGMVGIVTDVYIGDLLSWVMAKVDDGNVWITIQTHANTIAVAVLKDVSCVIITENAMIDKDTIKRANTEEMPLLRSSLNSYQLALRIGELLKQNEFGS
ncbi:MAG: AraC family transcriptional regulator [Clostridiales bacterium]|nr:AraC family transcriptional regulator [Clostridiales bacterium]